MYIVKIGMQLSYKYWNMKVKGQGEGEGHDVTYITLPLIAVHITRAAYSKEISKNISKRRS